MNYKLWATSLQLLVIVQVHSHTQHHHKKPEGSDCLKCPSEWGVRSLCNATHDTECELCGPGLWSPSKPHLQHCTPCSKCGDGLYVDRPCRPSHDTKCGWCAATSGGFNIDFIKKCVLLPKKLSKVLKGDDAEEGFRVYLKEVDEMKKARLQPHKGDQHHQFWKSDNDFEEDKQIVFKPSYHSYRTDDPLEGHKKRIYILSGIAGGLLLILGIFGLCLLRTYCCQSETRNSQRNRLYVQLSERDHQIIDDCASKLGNSRTTLLHEDDYWEDDPMKITENPLDNLPTKLTL